MKNKIVFAILAVSFAFLGNMVSPVHAADATPHVLGTIPVSETPLMVIRFNQPHVAYERPLYDTMVKALQAKPSARFDVVSVSQKANDPQEQQHYNDVAAQNAAKVMATFHEIGMPQTRLSQSSAIESVPSSEVRIYIR